jgi:secondary thiamine-phosphate synthase enzyme
MQSTQISFNTGREPTTVDITGEVAEFCRGKGDGLVSIFLPHATAGVALFETGAGTEPDVLAAIDDLLPAEQGKWRHQHGSPGHGRDHVLPAFISPSLTIPVEKGQMTLGTWQSIVVVDTNVDNPNRKVRLSFLGG